VALGKKVAVGAAVAPPKNPIKREVAPGGAYISITYAAGAASVGEFSCMLLTCAKHWDEY
jgi:hypothetical protein